MEVNVGKATLFTLNIEDYVKIWEINFPLQHLDLNNGVKYLGFILRRNKYGMDD